MESATDRPVVVGYDGRMQSRDALALTRLLASGWNTRALAVWVTERDKPYSSTERERLRERIGAGRRLKASAAELLSGVREWELSVQPASTAARGLHDVASEQRAVWLVVGSSHLGPLGHVLVGSTAIHLLVDAPCPIAVAPRGWGRSAPAGLKRLGVGLDGCPDCEGALAEAQDLADRLGAGLEPLRVADQRRAADELAEASHDLDLLVVGCRTCAGVLGHPLHSVSRRLIRQAACPVVVVPQISQAAG